MSACSVASCPRVSCPGPPASLHAMCWPVYLNQVSSVSAGWVSSQPSFRAGRDASAGAFGRFTVGAAVCFAPLASPTRTRTLGPLSYTMLPSACTRWAHCWVSPRSFRPSSLLPPVFAYRRARCSGNGAQRVPSAESANESCRLKSEVIRAYRVMYIAGGMHCWVGPARVCLPAFRVRAPPPPLPPPS